MTDFLDHWQQASEHNSRLVSQETLITEVTESLWVALEDAGITKSQLAERLGVTKGHVSQLFSGSRNMTLRTLADICFALQARPHFELRQNDADDWQVQDDEPLTLSRARPTLYLVAENGVQLGRCEWASAA